MDQKRCWKMLENEHESDASVQDGGAIKLTTTTLQIRAVVPRRARPPGLRPRDSSGPEGDLLLRY